MRQLSVLMLAMLLVAGRHASDPPRPVRAAQETLVLSLFDAIDQGYVEASFTATGAASGAVATVTVRRLRGPSLVLTAPAGTLLLNEYAEEQDLVVRRVLGEDMGAAEEPRRTRVITLDDDAPHHYVLDGYCIEALLDNPTEGAVLTPGGMGAPEMTAILMAVDAVPGAEDAIEAIQAAIWAFTDDLTIQELEEIGYTLIPSEREIVRRLLQLAGLDPDSFRLFAS